MARPFSLTIEEVRCFKTHNLLLSDDIVGVMGPVTIDIGTFDKPDDDGNVLVRRPDINTVVPGGEVFLIITERSLLGNADLGIIDLSQDMGQRRVVGVFKERAAYEFVLIVESVGDGLEPVG